MLVVIAAAAPDAVAFADAAGGEATMADRESLIAFDLAGSRPILSEFMGEERSSVLLTCRCRIRT